VGKKFASKSEAFFEEINQVVAYFCKLMQEIRKLLDTPLKMFNLIKVKGTKAMLNEELKQDEINRVLRLATSLSSRPSDE